MQTKHYQKKIRSRRDAGIALVTTLLLMFLMSSLLVGFCILLISNQQLAGSNNADVTAFYGAEAGMEQLTANLGNLFSQTYAPTLVQLNALSTNPGPPVIPGVSYVTGSGGSGYTVTWPYNTSTDSLGNPLPNPSTVKIGPYTGLTAYTIDYVLTVNARTAAGREVKLTRTTQTVAIPAFSFGVFCGVDCSFFAGPNFSFGGRTHSNGNLYLAEGDGDTLTLSDKVDAYGDIIRTELSNGYATSTNYTGTVSITTNPGTGGTCNACRNLAMTEGSYNPVTGTADANWPTISTGASPTDYNHNLIDGLASKDPTHSTGAKQLNLAVAIMGNGATQAVDLNRRALSGEAMTITAERYYDQASLRILLSDNKNDLMNLPCIDGSTTPLDLGLMASTLPSLWSASANPTLVKLAAQLAANNITPLPLATSGAAGVTGGAYSATDGYWLPQGYPTIKGFIKIEEQTSQGNASGCGTWKDVTAEILGYGYVGRNIGPVPQSLNGTTLNSQWPGTTAQMQPSYMPALPFLPSVQLAAQNATNSVPTPALNPGTHAAPKYFTAINTPGAVSPAGTCPDPHPYAIIRLERVRDNPSSVYYNSGALTAATHTSPANLPYESTVPEVCGWDTSVTPPALPILRSSNGSSPAVLPNTGAMWVPTGYDFWPLVLFDTREGELREDTMSAANLPTLNGSMSYIELDATNLTNWFAGKLGGIVTTGQSTRDPNYASNNYVVYISDRRGNYEDPAVQTISSGWPPLSYSQHETGEYGWTDIVNSSTDVTNGCPNKTLDTGEDTNLGTSFAGSLYYYGASAKYIHDAGDTLANVINSTTNPGRLGIFSGLTTTAPAALVADDNCATVPTYSTTGSGGDGIWPMQVANPANAPRENPPLFFRRAVKIINANNLTAIGTCPGGNNCGLAIATENPVYVQGDFNSNSAGNGFSDPYVATSISADAVTLLSNNWNDVNSFATPYCGDASQCTSSRTASTAYYHVAVLAGVSGSFPLPGGTTAATIPQDFGTNGGVHNFLRYIEDWGNATLNYRGSIVQLYYSRQDNGTFKCCKTVYSPPGRGYNFDTDFLDPTKLPPRTPMFRDVNTTGWTRLMLPSQ
jgi:hypothetical protein